MYEHIFYYSPFYFIFFSFFLHKKIFIFMIHQSIKAPYAFEQYHPVFVVTTTKFLVLNLDFLIMNIASAKNKA